MVRHNVGGGVGEGWLEVIIRQDCERIRDVRGSVIRSFVGSPEWMEREREMSASTTS